MYEIYSIIKLYSFRKGTVHNSGYLDRRVSAIRRTESLQTLRAQHSGDTKILIIIHDDVPHRHIESIYYISLNLERLKNLDCETSVL